MTVAEVEIASDRAPSPSFANALKTFGGIGLASFGGPTAQIALMHRVFVDEKRWLSEQRFLGALSFCMLLPGPEAMQLATYAGWRLHGVAGGLAAGLLFVLPGATVVLALAGIYLAFGNVPLVEAIFFGIKAAVLIIVVEALIRIGKRALKGVEPYVVAALAFVAIFFLALPFPLIILAAGLYGAVRLRAAVVPDAERPALAGLRQTALTILLWLAIWLVPLALIHLVLGADSVCTQIGWFFSKLAVVTFGGAYAVLAYMAQEVVQGFGWLTAGEMMDGLGLAETTPGPLILVTEFVAAVSASRFGGEPAWLMAVLGAIVGLWATFVPCFLWIFAGAPYIEWLNAQPRLKGALNGITAAVVGVILNLALWFALNVVFADVREVDIGILRVWTPDLASLDPRVLVLAGVSGFLLLHRHWPIAGVLGVSAGLAVAIAFLPVG